MCTGVVNVWYTAGGGCMNITTVNLIETQHTYTACDCSVCGCCHCVCILESMPQATVLYRIAGFFRGRKLSRISEK